NQMAAWTSGPEMTLPVTGAMDSVMAGLLPGPAAASLVREPLLLSPRIRPYVAPPRGASGGLEGEGQVVVDEADGDRALANGRRHPFDGAEPDVADREYAGRGGLERKRGPWQRPARRGVRTGHDEAPLIARDRTGQPAGERLRPDQDEQPRGRHRLSLAGV